MGTYLVELVPIPTWAGTTYWGCLPQPMLRWYPDLQTHPVLLRGALPRHLGRSWHCSSLGLEVDTLLYEISTPNATDTGVNYLVLTRKSR
jgi:hypothetical protein